MVHLGITDSTAPRWAGRANCSDVRLKGRLIQTLPRWKVSCGSWVRVNAGRRESIRICRERFVRHSRRSGFPHEGHFARRQGEHVVEAMTSWSRRRSAAAPANQASITA